MLRNGIQAPGFTLTDQQNQSVTLDSFRGNIVIVCFHRGTFCPTTDKFLSAYQDLHSRLKELSIVLLAISTDTSEENAVLSERLRIKFPLLSDGSFHTGEQYGVYRGEHRGKAFCEPALVVIDVQGAVAYSVISSGPKGLPSPGDVLPVLLYMLSHNGRY